MGTASAPLIGHNTVTVSSTAVVIVAANSKRTSLIIQNRHATDTLFVGATGVTIANGLGIAAGLSMTFVNVQAAIFGIRGASADIDVRYLEGLGS